MQPSDIADRLEAFVREQFDIAEDDPGFDRAADLFDEGYVDSIGLVELLEFIRVELGAEIPEDELLSPEFTDIEGIAKVISRSRGL